MINEDVLMKLGMIIMTGGFFTAILGLLIMFCASILGEIL